MSAKYILFLHKLKVEGRPFLEVISIYLSSKPSLTYGGNVNHYKSVHHPLSPLPVGIGNTLAAFKSISKKAQISKLFIQMSFQVYSLLGQSEGERKSFFRECKKGCRIVRLPLRALGCYKR